jgi:hypothetical protein
VIPVEDQFSAIIESGKSPQDPASIHAMLFSYFDDSSDSAHKKYFACGGLIGGEIQWKNLHVPWAVATIDLSEPFRSTLCECQQGQFKTWKKNKCDKLMARLVSILRELQLHGFASIVPVPEYMSVFPDAEEYDPYYLAVRHTIINMAVLGQRVRDTYNALGGMECWFENSETTSPTTLKI